MSSAQIVSFIFVCILQSAVLCKSVVKCWRPPTEKSGCSVAKCSGNIPRKTFPSRGGIAYHVAVCRNHLKITTFTGFFKRFFHCVIIFGVVFEVFLLLANTCCIGSIGKILISSYNFKTLQNFTSGTWSADLIVMRFYVSRVSRSRSFFRRFSRSLMAN